VAALDRHQPGVDELKLSQKKNTMFGCFSLI
jgi:hypothetical protein